VKKWDTAAVARETNRRKHHACSGGGSLQLLRTCACAASKVGSCSSLSEGEHARVTRWGRDYGEWGQVPVHQRVRFLPSPLLRGYIWAWSSVVMRLFCGCVWDAVWAVCRSGVVNTIAVRTCVDSVSTVEEGRKCQSNGCWVFESRSCGRAAVDELTGRTAVWTWTWQFDHFNGDCQATSSGDNTPSDLRH
jgi:hypothetical protein